MTNQLRLDPLTGRWITLAESRGLRPSAFSSPRPFPHQDDSSGCPFCPGIEEPTAMELQRYGPEQQWRVRVVANLYPAFSGDEPMVARAKGPIHTHAPASGLHEVLILSPEHTVSWADLDTPQLEILMEAIRDRIEVHGSHEVVRYSQFIVNHGREAGASMPHPHGQIFSISFVPQELKDEQLGFDSFVGGCLLCATVEMEEALQVRMVDADEEVVLLCPYWASVPYEMLLIPRHHGKFLHESSGSTLISVGMAIRKGLRLLRGAMGDASYNLVFHASPFRASGEFHWHVHIIPKLTSKAGFELGTGISINIVSPEQARIGLLAAGQKAEAS